MDFIKKLFNKQRGQALTEYILIAALVGLVLAVASFDLFGGIKTNYYHGMKPLSVGADIPESPIGEGGKNNYKPPVAKIGGPTTAHLGETVVFKDESYDVDGKIVGSSWGTKTISRTFMELGQHLIQLEVVDNHGLKSKVEIIVTVGNSDPTAIITFKPESEIFEGDGVAVSGSNSRDGDGDTIDEWEWYMTGLDGNREFRSWPLSGYTFKPGELKEGTYKFELIVTDKYQSKSEPAIRTLEVKPPPNQPPLAVITMSPEVGVDSSTTITWSYDKSSDPDGDKIVDAEWKNKQSTYPAGTHVVELRVKDEKGAWSTWVKKTFTVSEFVSYDKTYDYNGGIQTFTVPYTGTYKLELWGAEGGSGGGGGSSSIGGKGGYARGEIYLTAGQTLYIYVGGKGDSSCYDHCYGNYTNKYGGWNGGGNTNTAGGAGGGGGATDIRIGGQSLNNRKIVAGGGGGAGWNGSNGGAGGGLTGGTANVTWNYIPGTGGTQSAGGTGYSNGSLGQGGNGQGFSGGGGAGGGGYYGGGGGHIEAGGGGSSYTGGVQNGYTDSGVRLGNGYVKITRVNSTSGLQSPVTNPQLPTTNPELPTTDVQPPKYEY